MILLLYSQDNDLQDTMICSICQQTGHNRRTCSVVVRYEYDDCGVKCRINPNDEGDYQPVEPYCLPCGAKTEECDCGEYKCGKWFNEEKGKFQGAPRRSSPRRPKPKPACADCGQIETECHLEITAEGKTLCCDCLYIEKHPDATCHRCETKLYSKTLVLCGGAGGECETWYCATCHADGTHDCPLCGVSICEACGVPETDECRPDCAYQARRRKEEEEDEDRYVCGVCGALEPKDVEWDVGAMEDFRGDVVCPDCLNKPPSPTREQLIALGKYKLAKFQIGKQEKKDYPSSTLDPEGNKWNCSVCFDWWEDGKDNCKKCGFDFHSWDECEFCERKQRNLSPLNRVVYRFEHGVRACDECAKKEGLESEDETNWNEEGDDELCSAIDASGNALY